MGGALQACSLLFIPYENSTHSLNQENKKKEDINVRGYGVHMYIYMDILGNCHLPSHLLWPCGLVTSKRFPHWLLVWCSLESFLKMVSSYCSNLGNPQLWWGKKNHILASYLSWEKILYTFFLVTKIKMLHTNNH